MRLLAAILVCVGVGLAVAACGTGGADDRFVFTPVPYTVFPEPPCNHPACSNAYILTDDCVRYTADQVLVAVEPKRLDEFEAWTERIGFSVVLASTPGPELRALGTPFPANVVVHVPLGSVDDAVSVIKRRPGVVSANHNGEAYIPEKVAYFIATCRAGRPAATN